MDPDANYLVWRKRFATSVKASTLPGSNPSPNAPPLLFHCSFRIWSQWPGLGRYSNVSA